VIESFADKMTAAVFTGHAVRGLPMQIQRRARAKLLAIDAAGRLDDLRAPPGLVVPIRPNAFRRCLTNVVSNAVRHAGHVRVRASRTRDSIEIVVDDDGPGIPESAREDVFKPFYRVETSRNAATGGTGLGLAIARDVIRGHGGDIRIETAPEGGVRARLRMPV
jgi:two-component system osmolarity sensor histidine kinase EnvZ